MGKVKRVDALTATVKSTMGEYTVNEYTLRGITVRELQKGKVPIDVKNIEKLIENIEEGNNWIGDPNMQLKLCVITQAINEFVLFKDKPAVTLDVDKFDPSDVIHEMGHVIFNYYLYSKDAPKDAALQMADLFIQAGKTKKTEAEVRTRKNGTKTGNMAAGFWIAEPSQWSDSRFEEHPSDNVDEYFASLREAVVLDAKGLGRAVRKFSGKDPSVIPLGRTLVSLIGGFAERKSSDLKLTPKATEDAKKILQTLKEKNPVTVLEKSTLFNMKTAILFRMTMDPDSAKPTQRQPRLTPQPLPRAATNTVRVPRRYTPLINKEEIRPVLDSPGRNDPAINGPVPEKQSVFKKIFHSLSTSLGLTANENLARQAATTQLLNQQRIQQQNQQQLQENLREQQQRQREEQNREQNQRTLQQNQQRMNQQAQQESTRRQQMVRDSQQQQQRMRDDQVRRDTERQQEQQRQQLQQQQLMMRSRPPVFQKPPPLPLGPAGHYGGPSNYNPNGMFGGLFKPAPPPPPPKPIDFRRWQSFPNRPGGAFTPWERTGPNGF